MTVRAFIVLLVITIIGIALGDRIAKDFAAPGLERTFTVLVIATLIVAPCAWILGRMGWINSGRIDFSRNSQPPSSGGQA
jgi:uncharacterized membrane protein YfcA